MIRKSYRYIILWCGLVVCLPPIARAQRTALLDSIEAHNTTLRALRAESEAQRLMFGSDSRLPDPELEVDYMLGSPKGVPNRTNVSFSQSLDWGVLTGRRKDMSLAGGALAAASLRKDRQVVLSDALRQLTWMIYWNRQCRDLEQRLKSAREVQALYQKKYEQGGVNAIEVNKVKLNASVAQAELQRAMSERQSVQLELNRLNGGRLLECVDTAYADEELPPLSQLLKTVEVRHPQMESARAAWEQSKSQVRLMQAMSWPTFSVGFTGEYVRGNNYSGISLGVSLPLWGNTRSRIRQSKAEVLSRQLEVDDVRIGLSAEVVRQYHAALDLRSTADSLQTDLKALGNDLLLRRALDAGQISLLDYLLELSFYYTARTAQLEAERDAQLATAQLRSFLY